METAVPVKKSSLNNVLEAIFVAGTFAVLTLGALYVVDQVTLLENMKVGYSSAKILSTGLTSMSVNLTLKFSNTSALPLNLENYNLAFYVNDKYILTATAPGPGRIEAGTDSNVDVVLSFNPLVVLGDLISSGAISSLSIDYSKITIRAYGTITLKQLINIDVPVDESVNLGSLLS